MRLTVLNVAYPMAPVGPAVAGGAEHVLATLDRALVTAGHRSLVVAREGSSVDGELVATPAVNGVFDELALRRASLAHRNAIERVLRREQVDVVHLHGIDFANYLPGSGPPVLVTLHMPLAWYSADALRPRRPGVYLHCVSASQHSTCPQGVKLAPTIPNGVGLDQLRPVRRKRPFVLALGRICPEKGFHLAIDAAARAGMPLLLAGEVHRYAVHETYYREQIAPRQGLQMRYIGPLGTERKRRLLGAASSLIVASLVPETSSLVAMEAAACGTPVVAFPKGALTEVVESGRTGFLVNDVDQMVDAIRRASTLSPAQCRETAERRFSDAAMTARYLSVYDRLATQLPVELAEVS
jgi:glycosyltransferase involved in cell wall biosynthesis